LRLVKKTARTVDLMLTIATNVVSVVSRVMNSSILAREEWLSLGEAKSSPNTEIYNEFRVLCDRLNDEARQSFAQCIRDFNSTNHQYSVLTILKKNGKISGFDLIVTYR
jgi:hypothetical protein